MTSIRPVVSIKTVNNSPHRYDDMELSLKALCTLIVRAKRAKREKDVTEIWRRMAEVLNG